MTNKEHLIDLLHEHISFVDRKTIEVIFEAINKKDWAFFISQMGDYDHPSERWQAEKDLEAELEKITHPFGSLSYSVLEAVDLVKKNLTCDFEEACKFYNKNFHKMEEEYKSC